MKQQKISVYLSFLALIASSFAARAHDGFQTIHGFSAGLTHPLSGIDHLLVMLAVGLWAASNSGRYLWQLPGVFLVSMSVGAMLGLTGLVIVGVEFWIAFSVLALGVILLIKQRMPSALAVVLVAIFALGHGYVHTIEINSEASILPYVVGFLMTTFALLSIGLAAKLSGIFSLKALQAYFGLLCSATGMALLLGF